MNASGIVALTVAFAAAWIQPASAIEFLSGKAAALTGDSISVETVGHPTETIRLWGIKAPSMADTRDYGLYARSALDDLLHAHGDQVQCVIDSIDESAAVCHIGQMDVGEAMLKTGWAVVDRTQTMADIPGGDSERTKRAEAYRSAEMQARQARKGRWKNMP